MRKQAIILLLKSTLHCFLLWTSIFTNFVVTAFSGRSSSRNPERVLVTGAAGKTGQLVLKKLLKDERYEPKGLVRDEKSALRLIEKKRKDSIHCPLESIIISDITSPTFEEDLISGLDGIQSMIICTSAVPRISRLSLATAVIKVPWNIIRLKKAIDFRSLRFKWKHGGYPEKVDYHGQVAQINLAKKIGVEHVIVVSSMGGTDPNNFLNQVGKNRDGTGHGDILLWKRKAEMYLVQSGIEYTIIHPGGLVDSPGGEQIVLDVDDELRKHAKRTTISREDVADLCVASLDVGKGHNVSFDCVAETVDRATSPKTAEKVLSEFLETAKSENYAL